MRELTGFKGSGLLLHKGGEIPVTYKITVYGDSYSRRAEGQIDGDFDPAMALDLHTQSGLQLRLSTGQEVEIVITDGMGPFTVAVNTPLPSF